MTEDSSTPVSDAEEVETNSTEGMAEHERAKAGDLKSPTGFKRVQNSVFGRDTRFGRFLRALLRTVLLVVICAGLGALAVYYFLYRPMEQRFQQAQAQSGQMSTQLEQAQSDLTAAQKDLKDSQTQAEQAQSALDAEKTRVQVLRAAGAVTAAQLSVAKNDNAGAASALNNAQSALQKIQPQLQKLDATQVSTLQALFTLTKVDLDRDLKLAAQDLDRLKSELDRVDQNLK